MRKNERSAPLFPVLKKEELILQLKNVANSPIPLRLTLEGNRKKTVKISKRKESVIRKRESESKNFEHTKLIHTEYTQNQYEKAFKTAYSFTSCRSQF